MCIFLMVATNEICKFKVKFTLFSPSPVILNDDIHWTKLILFFLIWHIRGLFGFLQFMRRKGTHSLATTLNCIWLKKINVLFGKFCYFMNCILIIGLQKTAGLLPIEGVLRLGCYYLICMSIYVLKMCARYLLLIYIPYKYESVLIVFQLYFG